MSLFLNLKPIDYDKPIYRIVEPKRFFELFATRQNVLVHPSKWDDPYENFILKSPIRSPSGDIRKYDFHNHMYGQCWTLNKASDAMWRIYSHEHNGIRIKTSIRKLLASLDGEDVYKPECFRVVGKVRYLKKKELRNYANSIYKYGSLKKDDLFGSLLVKRLAFKHERELRILYYDQRHQENGEIFKYHVNPHDLIDQIMLDPRLSYSDFSELKKEILMRTEYSGEILRSLLYKPPEEEVLNYGAD